MKKDLPFILIISLVLLVGCTMPTSSNGNGGNDLSPAEQTEVALTVDAATGSNGGAVEASATPQVIEANTHTPGSGLEWSPDDKAKFITDVNYPDNSTFEPDVPFTKKWRIQNVGETTWTTDYKLVIDDEGILPLYFIKTTGLMTIIPYLQFRIFRCSQGK